MGKYLAKKKKSPVLAIGAVVVLLITIGVLIPVLFAFAQGQPVWRYQEEVDLTHLNLTVEEYEKLSEKMPDSHIIWMIPIGNQSYASTSQEILVDSVAKEDIPLFDLFDHLTTIRALNAECYEELLLLENALPNCKVEWAVHIGNAGFSPESEELLLDGTGATADELLTKLVLLPELKTVRISDCVLTQEEQVQLMEAYPAVSFVWQIDFFGNHFLNTDEAISLKGTAAPLEELIGMAGAFVDVLEIDLTGCGYSVEDLLAIQSAYNATVHSELSLYDVAFDTEVTELDFSGIAMENTDAVEQILPLLPKLEKVIMCDCGIPSEEMDALGKRNPQVRFIWNVKIGRATIRTDCTNFIGAKHGYFPDAKIWDPKKDAYHRLFDEDCVEFKYCIDMECLDLGHMGIEDYSFLQYMPKMKYLILADTHGTDFSVLENLTELIYLEVFLTDFSQTDVLLKLTKLEDLNIGHTKVDSIEDLKQMVWLDRLWMPRTKLSLAECQELQAALPDTQIDYTAKGSTDNGWRTGQNYYDMRDMLGMYYLH